MVMGDTQLAVGRRNRDRPRSLPKRVLGWSVVAVGMAMLVLPGPGLLFIALGVIILGRNNPTLRWWMIWLQQLLRRLCQSKNPTVRTLGWLLRRRQRQARLFVREQLHHHAQGRPLSPVIRLWIALTIVGALAGVGVSLIIILS
jgi:hypothetical protein